RLLEPLRVHLGAALLVSEHVLILARERRGVLPDREPVRQRWRKRDRPNPRPAFRLHDPNDALDEIDVAPKQLLSLVLTDRRQLEGQEQHARPLVFERTEDRPNLVRLEDPRFELRQPRQLRTFARVRVDELRGLRAPEHRVHDCMVPSHDRRAVAMPRQRRDVVGDVTRPDGIEPLAAERIHQPAPHTPVRDDRARLPTALHLLALEPLLGIAAERRRLTTTHTLPPSLRYAIVERSARLLPCHAVRLVPRPRRPKRPHHLPWPPLSSGNVNLPRHMHPRLPS